MQSTGNKETRTAEPENPTDMSVKPSTTESALPHANFRSHSFHTQHKATGKQRLLFSATDPSELLPMSGILSAYLTSMAGLCRISPSQFQELCEDEQLHVGLSVQICPNPCFPFSFRLLSSSSTCFDVNWNFLTR